VTDCKLINNIKLRVINEANIRIKDKNNKTVRKLVKRIAEEILDDFTKFHSDIKEFGVICGDSNNTNKLPVVADIMLTMEDNSERVVNIVMKGG